MVRGGRRLLLILGIVVLVSTVLLFSGSSDDAPRRRRYTPPDQNIETERKEEDEKQEIEQNNSDKSEGDEVDKDQTEGDQEDAEEQPKETENKEDQESNEKPEEDESEEAKQHKEDEENEKQDGKPDENDEPSNEQTTNNNNDDLQTDPQPSTEDEDAGSTTTPSQDDVTQTTEEEDKKDNDQTVSADELEKEEDQDDITLDAESPNNDTETTPQPKSEEAKPKKYFLIRGYPRSGTNWVSNVFNLHPKVSSTGELNLESSLWRLMQDFQQNSGLLAKFKDAMMDKVYASIRTLIFNMMDALPLHWSKMELLRKNPAIADMIEWIGDHSPQSMTFLDYVPEMKVVFIVRDPRDVAISYFFLHLTSCCNAKDEFCYRFVQLADEHADEFREEWDRRMEVHCANQSYYDYHPEELLVPVDSYWIEHVIAQWRERVEDYEDRLRLRGNIHLVRYEDLWNNFEEERVKLFNFLGLDEKEALPASYETKTKPGFPTNATDGFFRKGMIGDWKRWDEVASAEATVGTPPSSGGGLLDAGATKVAAASLCKFGYLPPARCGSTEATTATTPAPPPTNPLELED